MAFGVNARGREAPHAGVLRRVEVEKRLVEALVAGLGLVLVAEEPDALDVRVGLHVGTEPRVAQHLGAVVVPGQDHEPEGTAVHRVDRAQLCVVRIRVGPHLGIERVEEHLGVAHFSNAPTRHATIEDVTSVGLVLGAGGVVGHAYHAGTLATIAEVTGWDPRTAAVIVGTSAGSGVGANARERGWRRVDFAARITGEPLSSEGAALLKGMERLQPPPMRLQVGGRMPFPEAPMLLARDLVAPWRFRPGKALAALAPEGRVPTTGMGDRMRRLHKQRWPAEPLWICALRLSDGARVVFGRDAAPEPDVGTAVEASSAIPGYFAPVVIDGERYVDGGAHSPTNADLVAGIGLDLVVVVSPMSARTEALHVQHAARRHAALHRGTLTASSACSARARGPRASSRRRSTSRHGHQRDGSDSGMVPVVAQARAFGCCTPRRRSSRAARSRC